MNSAYFKARLQAKVPGTFPDSFAVITACNPDGQTIPGAENRERTEAFRRDLAERGFSHFPVNGYDPDSPHEEPGFGVVCDEETALALGRSWGQEAIFHVRQGDVELISCANPEERYPMGRFSEMVDD